MSGRRPPASYWRSPARQPSTNRRPPGPALALYHLSYAPDGRRSTCPPMSGRRPPASYWRSPARQPSTNRRPPGPASRPLHYREFTGVCPHSWMVRRRGRIRTCNIRFQRPSCCQIAPPAYMPVCASTHSLDATRRPGCDGHLPPLRPPANACCATTGWMPRGPATWVRCPSCPSRPTGGVPCVPARDSNLDLHPQRAACCHYTNRPLTPQSNRV